MQASTLDDLLTATIVIGLLLSVANLVLSMIDSRSNQLAQVKASSNLRELYERTYRRTPLKSRRLVSITRAGKSDRRGQPPDEAR